MTIGNKAGAALTASFVENGSNLHLELTNATDETLKCIEVLTIFLKDKETPGGGPSRAHIRFETIQNLQSKEHAVLSHKTWIDGKPSDSDHDLLESLRVIAGELKPYVLDISWQDAEEKTRFQRIPVGH
jgi:hypothetical protein